MGQERRPGFIELDDLEELAMSCSEEDYPAIRDRIMSHPDWSDWVIDYGLRPHRNLVSRIKLA